MKKFSIITAALLATTSVWAADLPNKKKVVTTPVPAAVTRTSADSLTVSYGQDTASGHLDQKTDDVYQLAYKHNLSDGFFIGGVVQTTQVPDSKLTQNLEAQAGYTYPLGNLSATGKLGVGEKFSTHNFGYYAVYGNLDYRLTDSVTLNAVQYRYRNAFDTTNDYESHQFGTGLTYNINSQYSVNAKVARNFDKNMDQTGDQFMVGLTVKF